MGGGGESIYKVGREKKQFMGGGGTEREIPFFRWSRWRRGRALALKSQLESGQPVDG